MILISYVLGLCFVLQRAHGNVIENGDFESGEISPWHCDGSHCNVNAGVLGKIFQ